MWLCFYFLIIARSNVFSISKYFSLVLLLFLSELSLDFVNVYLVRSDFNSDILISSSDIFISSFDIFISSFDILISSSDVFISSFDIFMSFSVIFILFSETDVFLPQVLTL